MCEREKGVGLKKDRLRKRGKETEGKRERDKDIKEINI